MHGLTGGGWKRGVGHWSAAKCVRGKRRARASGPTVDQTPPRQPPTLLRYGNSAREFDKIRNYAVMRVALFLAKRHKRGLAWGFAQVFGSRDELGLISLNGIVVAPRPNRPWRNSSAWRGSA